MWSLIPTAQFFSLRTTREYRILSPTSFFLLSARLRKEAAEPVSSFKGMTFFHQRNAKIRAVVRLVTRNGLACFGLALLLMSASSCTTTQRPITDEHGFVTDLRAYRIQGRQQAILSEGVTLHADRIEFSGKSRLSGTAQGRVWVEVGNPAKYAWMIEAAYAGAATFNAKRHTLTLSDSPVLERSNMVMLATESYTEMDLEWDTFSTEVTVRGPTRTDFTKSSRPPIPGRYPYRAEFDTQPVLTPVSPPHKG